MFVCARVSLIVCARVSLIVCARVSLFVCARVSLLASCVDAPKVKARLTCHRENIGIVLRLVQRRIACEGSTAYDRRHS